MGTKAIGSPTKEFFVGMLTRDIELSDAILDLLDNCLDGVIRMKGLALNRDDMNYYEGYSAIITITPTSFEIKDNCGGIPRDVAEKYAFRMGKDPDEQKKELPTVGIYGIGMKRAIFKMGRSAVIKTRNADKLYSVKIPSNWAKKEKVWDFDIEDIEDNTLLVGGGTIVSIGTLNDSIHNMWDSPIKIDNFVESLIASIQRSYSLIIKKGFNIFINNKPVRALPIELLVSMEPDPSKKSIRPYFYQQTFGDVFVRLAVGFYAPTPSSDEIDDENEMKRTSEDAGWTVICNDRVILHNDKTYLSGWGEAGIPSYHTQFIGIRGIVIFESKKPEQLPMTTTKRGIDLNSPIYAVVKDKMREGLKLFTNYTNQWKGRNDLERTYSTIATRVPIEDIMTANIESVKRYGIEYQQRQGGIVSKPELPTPPNDKPYRIIRFSRDLNDIDKLKQFFYHEINPEVTPSHIGERCFDFVLKSAGEKTEV